MSEDQKSHIYHLDDRSLLTYYCLPSCEEQDNNCTFFPYSIEVLLSYGDSTKARYHITIKFYYVNETGTSEKAYIIMYVKVYIMSYYFYNYFFCLSSLLKVNIPTQHSLSTNLAKSLKKNNYNRSVLYLLFIF